MTGLGPFFSIIAETWLPFALVCAGEPQPRSSRDRAEIEPRSSRDSGLPLRCLGPTSSPPPPAGLVWGVLSFWLIAPRLLPDHWAERALVEFGVSIGATSTGSAAS